jgi:hypothetical protein
MLGRYQATFETGRTSSSARPEWPKRVGWLECNVHKLSGLSVGFCSIATRGRCRNGLDISAIASWEMYVWGLGKKIPSTPSEGSGLIEQDFWTAAKKAIASRKSHLWRCRAWSDVSAIASWEMYVWRLEGKSSLNSNRGFWFYWKGFLNRCPKCDRQSGKSDGTKKPPWVQQYSCSQLPPVGNCIARTRVDILQMFLVAPSYRQNP